jgi:beta-glucosidase
MVLVKNDHLVLPLAIDSMARIAIVGPNAAAANIMGGGSSQVRAAHRTPPLMALRHKWADRIEIDFEPGCGVGPEPTPLEPWELVNANGDPGFIVEYWGDLEMRGRPDAVHEGDDFRIQYLGPPGDGIPYPHFAARAAATFTASTPGRHEFVLRSNAEARLLVDGIEVVDLTDAADADWFGALRERRWSIELTDLQRLPLAIEFVNPSFDTYGRTSLGCVRPVADDALDRAVDAAGAADAAIVIVGTSDLIESEGFDRSTLALPAGQDELVERIAAANPRTVVVVNSGGPVEMPWLDRVSAVVYAWFGGQELGSALADVLDGTTEPSGRMPFTVPRRIEDTPTFGNFPGEAGEVRYGEGLLIGHRWYDTRVIDVAVPFGHGGSYTTFEWSDIAIVEPSPGDFAVGVTVTNTGPRRGSDVVQVFVSPPADTPVFRPRRELKGFSKVHLDAGESRRVCIDLDWRAFAYWMPNDSAAVYHEQVRATPFASSVPSHVPSAGWTVHPGTYGVHLARSILDVDTTLEHEITDGGHCGFTRTPPP